MQGYDANKPAYLAPVISAPIRANFNAVATCHQGATAPANPDTGWLWLDTSDPLNYKLRMYLVGSWTVILNNLMAGFPTQSGAAKVVFTQGVAALNWTVVHNLNTLHVNVQVWDGTGHLIIPNSVTVLTVNTVQVSFLVAQAGKAIILG